MDSRDFLLEECQEVPPPVETSKCQNSSSIEEEFDPARLEEPKLNKVLCAKNWFLTFPRVTTTKEEALAQLQAKFKESLKGVLIAQELHKDGECSPWRSTTTTSSWAARDKVETWSLEYHCSANTHVL